MVLVDFELSGAPMRFFTQEARHPSAEIGLIGVDVARREIDGVSHCAIQVLLDDDHVGFDPTLLDGPLVVDVVAADGSVVAREPLDHDRFRRQLRAERELGRSTTRGVLTLTDGELPPPWIRLAFLPVDVADTAGLTLALRRTSVADLVAGVDMAYAAGALSDEQRRTALTAIDQLHPDFN